MNKKSVIRLFWISLGLGTVNLVLMVFIALFHQSFLPDSIQGYNLGLYLPVILAAYLAGGFFVYLSQGGFTLWFIHQLKKNRDSILGEILALIFFDVIWYWGSHLFSYVLSMYFGMYGGSEALVVYGTLQSTKLLILPVGGSGTILFKLAIGMSIFWKRRPFDKKNIQRLLGVTTGLATLFLLSGIPIFVFQDKILSFFIKNAEIDLHVPGLVYFTPDILRYLILMAAVTALAIQLKKGKTSMIPEIFGVILLSVTAWYLPICMSRIIMWSLGSEMMLALYGCLQQARYFTGQIDVIAVSLFTMVCGMMILWKKMDCNTN